MNGALPSGAPGADAAPEDAPDASGDRTAPAQIALLPDRGVVRVAGPDAEKLLQGIVTNDLAPVGGDGAAVFAGLLSPQGKILFEFFVVRAADGFLLEVARDQSAALAKRLALYRLRAKVEIADHSSRLAVQAMWGEGARCDRNSGYRDPRHPSLGIRLISLIDQAAEDAKGSNAAPSDAARYHTHRIALGIAEGGKDYDFGDAFPHEANFDLAHGVSFDKGCYVGQEVVARMQHKTVVRKRVVRVTGVSALPDMRPDIKAGEVVIGRLGSVSGRLGLAMLRLDRVLEFQTKGAPITAAGMTIIVAPDALDRYGESASAAGQKPL